MSFDIRLPIGLLFLAIGVILVALGLVGDAASLRTAQLGLNINLVWGVVMALFGLVMLALVARARRR
jgi:hypothetical protein